MWKDQSYQVRLQIIQLQEGRSGSQQQHEHCKVFTLQEVWPLRIRMLEEASPQDAKLDQRQD